MSGDQGAIRNISDTALWVAVYRAHETERPDAVFRDPLARALAGERGERISALTPFMKQNEWSIVARTYLFDKFISEQVARGADLVVNLAAGLDTRPYRLKLPPSLSWIEVDLPEIFDYKARILADEKPACALERIALDLFDDVARESLFQRLGQKAKNALVACEGLLIYLKEEQVSSLAQSLARTPGFARWVFDLQSPGLLELARKNMGQQLDKGDASLRFAPPEGPPYFAKFGWTPFDVGSLLKTAARLKRLPFALRLVALLPESEGAQGKRPWSAVCLMGRK